MFVLPTDEKTVELDGMAAYLHAIQNPDRNDPNWPLPSFDARDWAKAFVDQMKVDPAGAVDEGMMLGWFANALMRGYDEAQLRMARANQSAGATGTVALEAFMGLDEPNRIFAQRMWKPQEPPHAT